MLNFEGADLREVVRNILGDILNETYTIDPAVGGTVTIRTSSGIPRDALPATLETLLRMNGATMVKERRPLHGRAAGGRGARQRDAAARQLARARCRRASRCRSCRCATSACARCCGCSSRSRRTRRRCAPDELRNLLILSGTERELRHLMDTIDMFDIDWMAGMSAGVFTLQNADVKR